MVMIKVQHSSKIYGSGETEVRANDDISFAIRSGELTVIVGASGAGKSTLLNIIGGMDTNTKGNIIIDGTDISQYSTKKLTTYRRNQIGFVFQFYNLVPNLTAIENVELASEIAPNALNPEDIMREVGLGNRMTNFPAQLSGGEQQRVAIARAIAKNPDLLLCDEPTGALDYKTGKSILQLLQNFCHENHKNVIIVTHNGLIKPMADHVIEIGDGQVKQDTRNTDPTPVSEIEW
ncbi:ABC transporter ATP-binding protein [Furfurilactobacillus rossiae]|uniref:ABC superfamily ATP binding cassette transporter, ABC protein n=1 Tax=Furfurilactobacillus rossiae DSM 15814 TaxID=1114972 RepID=A0A0R1RL80_9LACO|nr:ABC transporter ATP-binding protein [Furfurilactobacillus rossiae]KRL54387.1 ABC superfamily ATP binding cassette transporter, ABC protein [Furfurilactobacillus rossiae DSM 15814]QFR66888.1 ATP-binding cassette domain-containing protein [Furfurilactobacillus rossiae]QLE62381.1 ABC transporter ATP-binding protein YvcR [Furfurilactobacillus rossiae]